MKPSVIGKDGRQWCGEDKLAPGCFHTDIISIKDYILVGEFTMYWGEDAAKVRAGTSEWLALKAGDLGYWAKGWKYSVENTGKVPGTFFWGLGSAPEGTKIRDYTRANYHLITEKKRR